MREAKDGSLESACTGHSSRLGLRVAVKLAQMAALHFLTAGHRATAMSVAEVICI